MILGKAIGIGAGVLALGMLAVPTAHAVEFSETVSVPASASAGVSAGGVTTGALVTISASGSAGYGYQGGSGACAGYPTTHPDGSRYLGSTDCGPKDDPNATLSGDAVGLLIARIGDGAWFAVGAGDNFTAAQSGALTVAYNDSVYSDNTGSYSVTVTQIVYGGGGSCPQGCPT
jgi:hypothetical protein